MRRLIFLLLMLVGVASAQVVPGVLVDASYPEPVVPPGPWSSVALGNGVCTSVSDSSGTLTVEASGVDADNSCFVYQTVSAEESGLGAQVYGQIFSITGDAAATTLTGSMIRNSVAQDAAYCVAWWNANQTKVKGAVRPADGAALSGGIDGNAVALPVHTGVSFVDSTNKCKLYDNDTSTTPANELTDFAGVPQPHQSYDADMANNFLAGFIVRSGHATQTATVTIEDYDVGDAVQLVDNGPDLDANLIYRSDFETGGFQAQSQTPDGWMRLTMKKVCDEAGIPVPDPRDPPRCYKYDNNHLYSDNIVQSDNGVFPRAGNYMLRLETHKEDYPIGNPPGVTNERAQIIIDDDTAAFQLEYNKTYWLGTSVYYPSSEFNPNFSVHWLQTSLYPDAVASCVGPPCSNHVFQLSYRPTNPGDTTPTSWRMRCNYYTSVTTMVNCDDPQIGYTNPFDAYKDEWVDFRIEVKMHATNGVLKVWTRRAEITNDFTLEVNYSGPLGWFNSDKRTRTNWQLYVGGNFPLVMYFDEIRITSSEVGSMTDVDAPPIAP